jgi:hypothetical protein
MKIQPIPKLNLLQQYYRCATSNRFYLENKEAVDTGHSLVSAAFSFNTPKLFTTTPLL